MTESTTPKWKIFESIVADIQSKLAPTATISQNAKFSGKHSMTQREIDIAIHQKVGQYDIFIAIDCKDYKRPVDVTIVGQFIDLVNDVGANKGVIVSVNGFTEGAKNSASAAGIILYTLVDTEKHDWGSDVSIPFLCDFRRIKAVSFKFSTTGYFKMTPQDPRTIILYRQNGEPIETTSNLLARKWNDGLIPIEAGEYKDINLVDEPTFIKTEETLYKMEVTPTVIVERNLYFNYVPIEIRGFKDEIKGGVVTTEFATNRLDMKEVERTWQKIESLEKLAVKPILTLVGTDHYPVTKDY